MGLERIFKQWRAARSYIGQAEELYVHLEATTTSPDGPRVSHVLLPIAYKRFIEANSTHHYVDEGLLMLVGQYLGKKYPAMEQYFVSEKCRTSVKDGKDLLDEFLKARIAKEQTTTSS